MLGERFLIGLVLAGLSIFLGPSLVVFVVDADDFVLLAGLVAGLLGGVPVFVGFTLAYRSAVAGLAISALRRGRTGAEDKVPTEVTDTFREAVDIAVAGRPMLDCEADFLGDPKGSADPGREGIFLPAAFAALAAFFCAAMVSLKDGLICVGAEPVLWENPDFPPVAGA